MFAIRWMDFDMPMHDDENSANAELLRARNASGAIKKMQDDPQPRLVEELGTDPGSSVA